TEWRKIVLGWLGVTWGRTTMATRVLRILRSCLFARHGNRCPARWRSGGLPLGLILTFAACQPAMTPADRAPAAERPGKAAREEERYTIHLMEVGADDASVRQSFAGENRTRLRDFEKRQEQTPPSAYHETRQPTK